MTVDTKRILLFFLGLFVACTLCTQADQYKIDFPWEHSVSSILEDEVGYYWVHDHTDFYYYNGHQFTPAGLDEALGKRRYEYVFSGDIVLIEGSLLAAIEEDLFLFDPKTKEIEIVMSVPDGEWIDYIYKDDLGDIWMFSTDTKNDGRPVYRSTDGLNYTKAFDLSDYIDNQGLDFDYELEDRDGLLFFHQRLGGLLILDNTGQVVQAPVQDFEAFSSTKECSQFRLDNQNQLWRFYNEKFETLDWSTGLWRKHALSGRFEFITDCKRAIEKSNVQKGLEGFGSLLNLRSIYTDSQGRIWMSCSAAYIVMFDPAKESLIGFRSSIVEKLEGGDYDNKFVFEDGNGTIWGCQKNGLYKIKEKSNYFEAYAVGTKDPNHAVYKLEDQAAVKKNIDFYSDYAIRNSAIHGIEEDAKGNLVFQEGVFTYYLDTKSKELRVLPLFNEKEKLFLASDGGQMLYSSWDTYGIFDASFQQRKGPQPITKIEKLFRHSDGTLWFAGIRNQKEFMFAKGDPSDYSIGADYIDPSGEIDFRYISVRDISEGEDGALWLASSKGILKAYVDKEEVEIWDEITTFKGESYRLGESINQLSHNTSDYFWFNTEYEFGLVNVTSGELKYLQIKEEKQIGKEMIILPVDDVSVWVGDADGVSYINFAEDTKIDLSRDEGIDTKGQVNVLKKLTSGYIAVGTNNGMYLFNPDYVLSKSKIQKNKDLNVSLRLNAYSYDDVSEEVTVSSSFEARNTSSISLAHNDKDINFEVSLLNFDQSSRHRYKHILRGFDDDWSSASADNRIYYSSLPPGDYQLEVLGSVNGGVWSKNMLNVDISVGQIWYRTWWFILLAILSLSSLVYFITYNYQQQKLKRQLTIINLRNQISKDLHDDVGTILTGIAMQTELLEQVVPGESKQMAHHIAEKSREAMGRMRDTVWAINLEKDSVEDLKYRMFDYVEEVNMDQKLTIDFDFSIGDGSRLLPPNVRQAAYLIFKESMANIVKHSDATDVNIKLHINDEDLSLMIVDNGSRKTKIKTSGQGLRSMKSRAETLGGDYRFDYDEGYRTSVSLPVEV